jgi:hypothetical protein
MKNDKLMLEIFFRVLVGTLVVLGVIVKTPFGLAFLLLSGILSGIYYGYHDDNLWGGGRKNNKTHNDPIRYNIHLIWIHTVCGLVAAISLYLLSTKINLTNPANTLHRLRIDDAIIFVISLLGYTGLLPRTFWFIANTGKIKG